MHSAARLQLMLVLFFVAEKLLGERRLELVCGYVIIPQWVYHGTCEWLILHREPFDSGSQNVQHVFGGFKRYIRPSSMNGGSHEKNSSDLERAAAA